MISAISPNQEGVVGTDSEEVWIHTETSAILVMSTSLLGTVLFFLIKEAYFYAGSLLVTSRCAIRGYCSRTRLAASPGIYAGVHDISVVPDTEEGPITLPTDFQEALQQHPAARSLFERLSYTKKKRFVDRIEQAEGEAARSQQVEKTIEQLQQIHQIHQQHQQ